MADLSDTIATEAALPASSTADGQASVGRSLPDLIAADKYLAGKAARASRRRGILFSQIVTPGALADGGRPVGPDTFFAGGLG